MNDAIMSSCWQPVVKSAKFGVINKILVIFTRLVSMPLLFNYLGAEQYGLWMTFASISAFVMIFDMGISMALVNRLTCFYVAHDRDSADGLVVSSFSFLLVVALFGMLISLAIMSVIDLSAILKLSSQITTKGASASLTVALLMFLAQLPLTIILKVPYAMQLGWLSELYQLSGTVISFLGTVVGIYIGANFPALILFLTCSPVVAGSGLLAQLVFTGKLRLFLPSFKDIRRNVGCLRDVGLDFLLMQVTSLLIYSLQFTLLAVYRGGGEVAQYGLLAQVLIALQVPFTVLQQPLWTRMTLLVHSGDFARIRKMVMSYLRYACCYSLASSCVMLFLVNPVLSLVLSKPIIFSFGLRIGFAAVCSLGLVAGGFCGSVLLALNLSRPLALLGLGQLIIFLGCVFVFVPVFGAAAMILSVCATYILVIPTCFCLIRNQLWRYDITQPSNVHSLEEG